MENNEYVLQVEGLRTVFNTMDGQVVAVDNVSYKVRSGEIIGIVGESGCGKSVTQYSIMQLINPDQGKVERGEVNYEGKNLLNYKPYGEEMRSIRGSQIGLIFQEPITSLNPALTVGQQIEESLRLHLKLKKADARKRAIEMLELVGIPDPETRIDYYPYQFSGGMCQRVMIAMVISCNPKILIADEATTALDVTTQEQILELLKSIAQKTGTAIVLITHNLGIVARYADRIYVMYAGCVIESGTTDEIFYQSWHPYTKGLLRAVPRIDRSKDVLLSSIDGVPPKLINKPNHCDFCPRCKYATDECRNREYPPASEENGHMVACYRYRELINVQEPEIRTTITKVDYTQNPLLEVKDLVMRFPQPGGLFEKKKEITVLDGVSFNVYRGETLGLVGESGCGKSTVSNCILRFLEPTSGQILYDGHDIAHISKKEMYAYRKKIQIVSQSPFASMDPRQSVKNIIAEPLVVNKVYKTRAEIDDRVAELLELVGLDPAIRNRMPHEFSGGQRQRISVARALALRPELLICDEPVSALDVSIQAQIVNLFMDLRSKFGLSYIFIAHGLEVVRHVSDRIVVMYLGQIVEQGTWDEICDHPLHPYTQALISAIPIPDPEIDRKRERIVLSGEVASVANRISGCNFCSRCRFAQPECAQIPPILEEVKEGHFCACRRAKELMTV